MIFRKLILYIVFANFYLKAYKDYQELDCSKKSIEFINLESILTNKFVIIKSENAEIQFQRTVYFDNKNDLFIKIWSKYYIFALDFLDAFDKGFYRDIFSLKAIVFDTENNCRGYIAFSIKRVNSKLIIENGVIQDSAKQNKDYQRFIEILYKKMINLKIIYYDLVHDNLVYNGKDYYIVDLEPVMSADKFKLRKELNYLFSFNPPDYVLFIKNFIGMI